MSNLILSFAFFLAIALNLFVKIYPRRHLKMYCDDSWAMMLWARKFRNRVMKKDFCDFLISEEKYYYPELLLKFLSIFREDMLLKFNWLFSPLFDTLSLALVFLLSYFLSGSYLISLLACAIYTLFPPLVFQSAFLHARTLGHFLFNVAVILIIFAKYFASFPCLILGVVFAGLLLDAHVFSTQAFIFVMLGLSLVEKTLFYAALLPFTFAAAIILSGGFYLTVLFGHLKLIRTHYRNIYMNPYDKFDFQSSIFKSFFWGLVLLLIHIFTHSAKMSPLIMSLSNWSSILFIVFILTTFIVPLRSIGQGYRYMEYAIVPISVLFAYAIVQYNPFIFPFFLFLLYALFSVKKIHSHFNFINNDYINIVDAERLKMFDFIKSSALKRIFCIPSGMSQGCAYFTGRKVLFTYYDWDNFAWLFPQAALPLKFDLSGIFKKYKLDALLLHTKFAQKEELKADCRLIYQEGPYLLLELNR